MEDEKNLDAVSAMLDAFEDDDLVERTSATLEEIWYGKPVNKNPLTKIPKSEMDLYYIKGHYFDTLKDLKVYCKSKGISRSGFFVVSYLRKCANRNDVIMKKSRDGNVMLYTAVDEDGYAIYDNERSIYCGKFVWNFENGDISELYKPFRDRGIVFTDDRYAKIDEKNRELFGYCKKYKL